MAEREKVQSEQVLNYEGLFRADELYTLIDNFFEQKGYDKVELKNVESVGEEGKYLLIVLQPTAYISPYAQKVCRVRVQMKELKDAIIEKEGAKIHMDKGKIHMTFEAWLHTDYEGYWQKYPVWYFLRMIYHKLIKPESLEAIKSDLASDIKLLQQEVHAFLNLQRHRR